MGLGLAGLLLLASGPEAQAVPVTFDFSGVVTFVDPLLSSAFSVGDLMVGSYTFESTTPDMDPSTETGFYQNVMTSLSVTIGSYSASSSSTGGTILVNNNLALIGDLYEVTVEAPPLSGPDVDGRGVMSFSITLADPSASALSSDVLPLSPPALADFSSGGLFNLTIGEKSVAGPLGSLLAAPPPSTNGPAPIPEPSTVVLLASGLMGLAARLHGCGQARRRRKA